MSIAQSKRSPFFLYFAMKTCGPDIRWASRRENCLWWFANNKGADQTAHLRSLISASVIWLLESIKSKLATHEISSF